MAINLQANTAVSFDEPVTMQELQAAVGKRKTAVSSQPEQTKPQENVSSNAAIKTQDVKLCKTVSDNKAVRHIAKKVRHKSKTKDEAFEKVLKDNKVRKYTKEMQNRDAIVKKSKAMRKRAQKTASSYDDKFAEAAAAPTKQFDKIIYGSATTGDAENMLDSNFTDVMDLAK